MTLTDCVFNGELNDRYVWREHFSTDVYYIPQARAILEAEAQLVDSSTMCTFMLPPAVPLPPGIREDEVGKYFWARESKLIGSLRTMGV
jgi:hypothetical protein